MLKSNLFLVLTCNPPPISLILFELTYNVNRISLSAKLQLKTYSIIALQMTQACKIISWFTSFFIFFFERKSFFIFVSMQKLEIYPIVSEHTNFNLKTTIEGWFPNFSSLILILHLLYPFFNYLCNLSMINIDNSGLCVTLINIDTDTFFYLLSTNNSKVSMMDKTDNLVQNLFLIFRIEPCEGNLSSLRI